MAVMLTWTLPVSLAPFCVHISRPAGTLEPHIAQAAQAAAAAAHAAKWPALPQVRVGGQAAQAGGGGHQVHYYRGM